MVARPSVCLRRLARGRRAQVVAFGRFLANPRVTVDRLIEGWGEHAAVVAAGRHILAIQDTSEINFRTTSKRRRGLGKIGKGGGRGVLLHAMLALDANTGSCLGPVTGRIWTRRGLVKIARRKRRTESKESYRWIETAERAKTVLAAAATVTVVADRESDIFAEWVRLPGPNFHLITRCKQDRRLMNGASLYAAAERFAFTATRLVALLEREGKRKARLATLTLRFGKVELARPQSTRDRNLPKSVSLTLVEVVERNPSSGTEAVHWRHRSYRSCHCFPETAVNRMILNYDQGSCLSCRSGEGLFVEGSDRVGIDHPHMHALSPQAVMRGERLMQRDSRCDNRNPIGRRGSQGLAAADRKFLVIVIDHRGLWPRGADIDNARYPRRGSGQALRADGIGRV